MFSQIGFPKGLSVLAGGGKDFSRKEPDRIRKFPESVLGHPSGIDLAAHSVTAGPGLTTGNPVFNISSGQDDADLAGSIVDFSDRVTTNVAEANFAEVGAAGAIGVSDYLVLSTAPSNGFSLDFANVACRAVATGDNTFCFLPEIQVGQGCRWSA